MLRSPSPEWLQRCCWASALARTQQSRRMIRSLAPGDRDELVGLKGSAAGAVPAHERFDGAELAAGRVDHRLVLQEQVLAAAIERGVQCLLQFGAGDQRLLHRLVIDLHAGVAGALGSVYGEVGAREQLRGFVGGSVEREGDADAGADADAQIVDVDRLAGRRHEPEHRSRSPRRRRRCPRRSRGTHRRPVAPGSRRDARPGSSVARSP